MKILVRLEEETSNALFEVLADWDTQISHYFHDIFFDDADTDERGDPDASACKIKKPDVRHAGAPGNWPPIYSRRSWQPAGRGRRKARQARLNKGLRGVWDWLSGRAGQVREQNRMEAWEALKRDQGERDNLIARQIDERQALQQDILELRERQRDERADLSSDIGAALKLEGRKAAYQKQMRRSAELEQKRKRRDPGLSR